MSAWAYKSETRDPMRQMIEREGQDCKRIKCRFFSTIIGKRWCEKRQRINPYNVNCSLFKETP